MPARIAVLSFAYAIGGVLIEILSATASCKLFGRVKHFSFARELEKANLAFGTAVGGLFVMIGLIIGLGLN